MRAKLTERERRVVLAIHRLPRPTFRELADYIGWRSTSTLFAHVRQLRRKRVLTQPENPQHRFLALCPDIVVTSSGEIGRWVECS